MPAPRVRADFDQLQQIAQRFGQQSEKVQSLYKNLNQKKSVLEGGDWVSNAATKFYAEMNSSVMPSLNRLGDSLSSAQQVTLKMRQIMKTAEEEAAALFKGGGQAAGAGGSSGAGDGGQGKSGGGFLKQVGGFFSGVWEGAKGMATGLYHVVRHPIDTLKGLAYAVTHPGELWDALKKPYVEDWQSGNYGRAIGRGAFEVAMLLIPGIGGAKAVGKGAEAAALASKAAKAAEVAEVAGVVAKGSKAAEVVSVTSKGAEAAALGSKAAEMADVAATFARNQRIAAEALASADKASDAAKAADVFNSAQKALGTPGASEAIAGFKAADAGSLPGVIDNFGGGLGRAGDIPAELAERRVTLVGRNAQTVPAGETGSRILKVPGETWSPELNALWLKEAVNNGDVFKLATEVADNMGSLRGAPEYGGISVYTRELNALKDAGYTRVGDYLVPPRR